MVRQDSCEQGSVEQAAAFVAVGHLEGSPCEGFGIPSEPEVAKGMCELCRQIRVVEVGEPQWSLFSVRLVERVLRAAQRSQTTGLVSLQRETMGFHDGRLGLQELRARSLRAVLGREGQVDGAIGGTMEGCLMTHTGQHLAGEPLIVGFMTET
ncbi:hypothetical protein E0H75_26145 [Kribbella capetownensis]|uniref:Uncharacterized protein n=1 Tax=Kribbella capetownensis TaxID=1572659 RepID=A0A4R0JL49_9ACTN|nr:hypothetical protein [Kribbella capetownensis]TCC46544.1 hypothetical protein E0H75_26145 [Kribbella capetownensis]